MTESPQARRESEPHQPDGLRIPLAPKYRKVYSAVPSCVDLPAPEHGRAEYRPMASVRMYRAAILLFALRFRASSAAGKPARGPSSVGCSTLRSSGARTEPPSGVPRAVIARRGQRFMLGTGLHADAPRGRARCVYASQALHPSLLLRAWRRAQACSRGCVWAAALPTPRAAIYTYYSRAQAAPTFAAGCSARAAEQQRWRPACARRCHADRVLAARPHSLLNLVYRSEC